MIRCKLVSMTPAGLETVFGWFTIDRPPEGVMKVGPRLFQVVGFRWELERLSTTDDVNYALPEAWMLVVVNPVSQIQAAPAGALDRLPMIGKRN
jgi:hypothetical protein